MSILPKKKVRANSHHFFSVKNKKIFTHIKFNIFPDGGVARLRLYGSIAKSKQFKNKCFFVEKKAPAACCLHQQSLQISKIVFFAGKKSVCGMLPAPTKLVILKNPIVYLINTQNSSK